MLNLLCMYEIQTEGSRPDTSFSIAAVDVQGALKMAQEYIGHKDIVVGIQYKGSIVVEQPDVE